VLVRGLDPSSPLPTEIYRSSPNNTMAKWRWIILRLLALTAINAKGQILPPLIHTLANVRGSFTPAYSSGKSTSVCVRMLRHEVARLIVWQAVTTRPVVPSTVSYEVRQQGNALSKALG